MLKVQILPLGPLQTNCFVAACEQTGQAAVVDPAWDGELIYDIVTDAGWQISHILLTHAHFDHVGGLAALKAASGAPVLIHPEAIPMLEAAPLSAARWGLQVAPPPPVDQFLENGQPLQVGTITLGVLYTPGHAPGHVSFHAAGQQALFDGDVLFEGSIGRTDLPGADFATLIDSIQNKLLTLPDDTQVFPGHGNPTTIGRERRTNPFLQGIA